MSVIEEHLHLADYRFKNRIQKEYDWSWRYSPDVPIQEEEETYAFRDFQVLGRKPEQSGFVYFKWGGIEFNDKYTLSITKLIHPNLKSCVGGVRTQLSLKSIGATMDPQFGSTPWRCINMLVSKKGSISLILFINDTEESTTKGIKESLQLDEETTLDIIAGLCTMGLIAVEKGKIRLTFKGSQVAGKVRQKLQASS